jgi:hypothetical protein
MAAHKAAPQSVGLVWEQAERRLEAQIRQADGLDTKAGVLVGLHAVAATLVASAAPRVQDLVAVVATIVLILLLVSGGLALLAFRAQDYDRSPRPEELWRFAEWTEDEIRYRFLSTRFRALEENRVKLRLKAQFLAASLSVLAMVGLVVVVVGLWSLWS